MRTEGARIRTARRSARRRSRRDKWRWFPTIVGVLVALVVLASRNGGHGDGGHRVSGKELRNAARTVHYTAWAYVNPVKAVGHLQPGRIDMGVDYAGSGPILALGNGTVTMASDHDSGPPSCWGRTCWPVGGIVVYRLSDGPFAGKYVYVAENITVDVKEGQKVRVGQQIATARDWSPHIETGWASGTGSETLAIADGHQCRCGDPGGWSTIEGRSFDALLVALGAVSGYLQPDPPKQSMPAAWPSSPQASGITAAAPQSKAPLGEGATASSRTSTRIPRSP